MADDNDDDEIDFKAMTHFPSSVMKTLSVRFLAVRLGCVVASITIVYI